MANVAEETLGANPPWSDRFSCERTGRGLHKTRGSHTKKHRCYYWGGCSGKMHFDRTHQHMPRSRNYHAVVVMHLTWCSYNAEAKTYVGLVLGHAAFREDNALYPCIASNGTCHGGIGRSKSRTFGRKYYAHLSLCVLTMYSWWSAFTHVTYPCVVLFIKRRAGFSTEVEITGIHASTVRTTCGTGGTCAGFRRTKLASTKCHVP